MPILRRTRSAQYPLVAEFVFNYQDAMAYMTAVSGPSVDNNRYPNVTDFGSQVAPLQNVAGDVYVANTNLGTNYFELIALPEGAQVIGGDVQIEAPYVGPSTVTLTLGDANGALYMPSTTLKATAWTNAPTNITNAATNPQTVTITNSTANGITAIGQTITIGGCTGASALYNGNYIVDSYTATQVVVTNPQLTTSLTLAGTPTGTYITGRIALLLPDAISNQAFGLGNTVYSRGEDAAAGVSVVGTLTFSGGQPATQGRVRVRVSYTIDGRSNEVITT